MGRVVLGIVIVVLESAQDDRDAEQFAGLFRSKEPAYTREERDAAAVAERKFSHI